MLQEELALLVKKELQDFIFANENEDERDLVLRNTSVQGVRSSLIADQISGRRKAKFKLPPWYRTRGIVYPPSVNLEQSSSEIAAHFKAKLIASTNPTGQLMRGVDLSCG